MTAAEVTALWDYQLRTGARSTKFGAWVTTLGFGVLEPSGCSSATQAMAFTPAAPLSGSGITADAALTSQGLYK